MTTKEETLFLQIVKDFDPKHFELFSYNYYDVLGLVPGSEFLEEKYNERNNYINIEFKSDRELSQNARICLNKAKSVLSNPAQKEFYDKNLRKLLITKLTELIQSFSIDGVIDQNEKSEILKRGISLGFSEEEVLELLRREKEKNGYQYGKNPTNKEDSRKHESTPKLRIDGACKFEAKNLEFGHTYSGKVTLRKSGSGELRTFLTPNRPWIEVEPSEIRTDDYPVNVSIKIRPGKKGLVNYGDQDIGEIKIKSISDDRVVHKSIEIEASVIARNNDILKKIKWSPLYAGILALLIIVYLIFKSEYSGWSIFGLIASGITLIWGGCYLFDEYEDYFNSKKKGWDPSLPDFWDHLGLAAGLIVLFFSSFEIFISVSLVGLSFGLLYLLFSQTKMRSKYLVPGIPSIMYIIYFLVLQFSVLSGTDYKAGEGSQITEAGIQPEIQTSVPENSYTEEDLPASNENPENSIEPGNRLNAEDNLPEKKNVNTAAIKGKEVKNTFFSRSDNVRNLERIFNYVNKGQYRDIFDLVTKNSELEVLLYGKRFTHDYLVFRKKKVARLDIDSYKEFKVSENFSYLIVKFSVHDPKKPFPDYSRTDFIRSLSPWLKSSGGENYRDSIPVINGKIEFHYGKDEGLMYLDKACFVESTADWLNIREKPSLEAKKIGKIKKEDAGEWYEMGEIYDLRLSDNRYIILADPDKEMNGFIHCYFIVESTGKYAEGYVWKEYLELGDYVYL